MKSKITITCLLFLAVAVFAGGTNNTPAESWNMPSCGAIFCGSGMTAGVLFVPPAKTATARNRRQVMVILDFMNFRFIFAGCTVIYFITAAFFLPETKGKTLEEIEEHFEGRK